MQQKESIYFSNQQKQGSMFKMDANIVWTNRENNIDEHETV